MNVTGKLQHHVLALESQFTLIILLRLMPQIVDCDRDDPFVPGWLPETRALGYDTGPCSDDMQDCGTCGRRHYLRIRMYLSAMALLGTPKDKHAR